MRIRPLTFACAAALGAPLALLATGAVAQTSQQKVTPPIAVYWVSAETNGGMAGMPGGGAGAGLLGGLVGGLAGGAMPGASGGRTLLLQLGSARSAAGEPRAAHEIPAGMNMGPSLPLLTPRTPPREPRERGEEPPENFEKPKGRMLIYWGCGEQTRAGQPIVIDFAKIAAGQIPKFPTIRVQSPRGPSFSASKTYGDWPNVETKMQVPANASLVGEHQVKGNYSPDIRFNVADRTDFMATPSFQPVQRTAGGGMSVQWAAIPNATGYFLSAMGSNQRTQDMVIWSSSEIAEMGWAMQTFISPSEVARLIKERVILSPATTECTVPAEVMKQAETPMAMFSGYGDELNVVHPPRPTDPKVTWEQIYAVKVRQRTGAMLMLTEGGAASAGRRAPPADGSQPPANQGTAPAAPAAPTVTDVIKEGVGGVLRGLFGR
jgi:hypothetical protein